MIGKFPPHLGGVASHTYNLAKQLKEKGYHISILTYPHEKIEDKNDIKVSSAPTINIKGLRGLIFTLTATHKLIKIIRKEDIDIIHAHYIIPPGLIALIGSIITGKPYYVTVHGSDALILSSKSILRPIIKLILRKASKVLVVSKKLAEKVTELGIPQEKIMITYNMVDTKIFNPQIKTTFREEIGTKKPIILFVGNLVPQKGVEYLLKAKKLLKRDSKLVIVGGGPLLKKLKNMVKEENIEDVIFTGPRTDINNIMAAADIIVLPSVSEGIPIVLLEAMAMAKPIIATKVGGIPEIVDESVGILIEPKNPKKLANAIDKLLSDEKCRKKLGENGLKKAAKFSTIKTPY
ncbi:MAG: glycosyltransferase [Methanobacteriales archaeon]|uniref:Glycosyl transferase family 1 n=2 Tax=Methanothermobacter tenebrarum TaxID=680118 RepID=A0A328PG73_9EURY|nr:glycosyltransferase [Methanobacteriales archaeon]NPV64863.1 glycosyltransferase [Methanobacteriaceae archaeon]RAO79472.1 glycosyl transferase family 1 [Methanothermobacter tenebrarum]